MMQLGYESVYIQERMGHGLVPDSFMAYKKQRFRWAYGAVQILKAHWRALVPFRETGLTAGQKYHFVSGWLPWFADGFYLMFCLTSLFWTAGMVLAPRYFDTPLAFFILPTVGVFIAKIVHHIFLYTTRVKCGWKQRLLSAVAGMGLTYAIAWAMWQGIFTKHTPFMRTPKMAEKVGLKDAVKMTLEETSLMLLHWLAALAVLIPGHNYYDPEIRLWSVVLVVQSMPFLAALVASIISTLPSRPAPEEKAPSGPTPEPAE